MACRIVLASERRRPVQARCQYRPVGRGPSFILLSPSAPTLLAGASARFRWPAPWARGKGAHVRVSLISFPVNLTFVLLVERQADRVFVVVANRRKPCTWLNAHVYYTLRYRLVR